MDAESRTTSARAAFAAALLTTFAFALGFAAFALIGSRPTWRRGGRAAHAHRRPRGVLRVGLADGTPIVALATVRVGRFKAVTAPLAVLTLATCTPCSPTATRCRSSRARWPTALPARFWRPRSPTRARHRRTEARWPMPRPRCRRHEPCAFAVRRGMRGIEPAVELGCRPLRAARASRRPYRSRGAFGSAGRKPSCRGRRHREHPRGGAAHRSCT